VPPAQPASSANRINGVTFIGFINTPDIPGGYGNPPAVPQGA
jgi:hypothetical protein